MSQNHAPGLLAPDAVTTPPAGADLSLHAAFCGMALPMRSTRGPWQRASGTATVSIEPGAEDQALPGGQLLRLGLLHICDTALRTNDPVVPLGDDPAACAALLGIDRKNRDLPEQLQRLLAAKITIAMGDAAEVSVFDARSRPRAGSTAWRPSVRLSTKFLASLRDHVVALDRGVVGALSQSAAALDAYAWIRQSLSREAAGSVVTASWDDLRKQFGTPSQDGEAFRTAFETALRLVFDADRSVAIAVDDDGVSIRQASPDDEEAAPSQPATRVETAVAESPADPPLPAAPTSVVPDALAVTATAPSPAQDISPPAPPAAAPRVVPDAAAIAATAPSPAQQAPEPAPPRYESPDAPEADAITQDSISLPRHLTGLAQVIWLRRGHGEENVLVGVTPGARFDPARLTVLAVEPMVVQVSGGLYEQEFDRVSAWIMMNRDLIDDFWEGGIASFTDLNRRIRKAPSPGWR